MFLCRYKQVVSELESMAVKPSATIGLMGALAAIKAPYFEAIT